MLYGQCPPYVSGLKNTIGNILSDRFTHSFSLVVPLRFFSFRTNEGEHHKRQKLICQIIAYILKKINGDVFFSYQNDVAHLERRSGVLAITPETFKYFPELEGIIDSPYIIKTLQIIELPDDVDYEE